MTDDTYRCRFHLLLAVNLVVIAGASGWFAAKRTGAKSTADDARKARALIRWHMATTCWHIYQSKHYLAFIENGRPARSPGQAEPRPLSPEVDAALRQAGQIPWKDPEPAIAAYSKVIELDQKCADAYVVRGMLYTMKKEYPKAIADYTEAIRIGDFHLHRERGDLYVRIGELDKAIADYTHAINQYEPGMVGQIEAYTHRGIVYAMRRQFKTGLDDFEKVAEFDFEKP